MGRLARTTLLLLMLIAASGCSVRSGTLYPPQKGQPTSTIFLVGHGLHAGIIVNRDDIVQTGGLNLPEFVHMEYLEIGWGDQDYYTSPDPGLGLGAKALVLPTASVLHVVGFSGPPERFFPAGEIIRLELTLSGFEQMVHRLEKSFSRDNAGAVIPLGPGHYGFSRFYASGETYHLCRTCNAWTAAILRSGGVPVGSAVTVDGLMSQVRPFGEVIQKKSESQ